MTNNEILREFLLETHENLALLDSDLITLEKNPTEKNTLAQVFRTLHSVKGTAGFLGLVKLQSVAHSAESLLSKLRAGEMRFSPTIATAMLNVVDAIREMLANIEESGEEGDGDYSAVITAVDRLRETTESEIEFAPSVDTGHIVVQQVVAGSTAAPATTQVAEPTPTQVAPSPAETMDFPALGSIPQAKSVALSNSNIRVDVDLLDKLMTLVGELVLARNQILRYSASHEDDAFLGPVQRLNLLTSELQASVMKTRMQPIGNVLNKFPRVVRDLALACGKKVRFETEGEDTELDKSLLEAIRDPLTHMVRNAIDHGVELPEIRKSQGKSEEGCLRMVACHEGGKVIIEVSDDGSGVNVDRVREKAISAKLVSPEIAARLSPDEILRLIFLPGFSTSDRVTQFSGRGVGMDVVRTNIEKIGGTVDIESPPGQGTTIRTKIPLTLAIIPTLIIVSGSQRFAIPQVSLLEIVRIIPEQASRGIERIHGAPVYRLRGTLLPLVFLAEQLQLAATHTFEGDLNIIVLQADERSFGLVVDAICDTEEVVVKPLQNQIKGIPVFSGAAILGDGRVALVLDILGLAQRASAISGSTSRALGEHERTTKEETSETQSLLLFAPRLGGQMAIPLSIVARLEEFPRSALQYLGERQVAQYLGEILPLADVSNELLRLDSRSFKSPRQNGDESDIVPVVVVNVAGDQQVGLIVDQILDIVYDKVASRSHANRPGVLFTAIVQEKVTEFIDVAALVNAATTSHLQRTS